MHETPLTLELEPDDPLPLYHQIVVALRYRIATGTIERGARLPPIRAAAERWGVNYHTVRRAYAELEAMGLVEGRRGAGTKVIASLRPVEPPDAPGLSGFLDRVAQEGRRRFGLAPRELARLLGREPVIVRPYRGDRRICTLVECNAHQCSDLADQIRRRFDLEVHERLLDEAGEPPPGPIIGTGFHLAEMLAAWPDRRAEMYFPALQPDPLVGEALRRALEECPLDRVPLCERERTLAEAMAEDVRRAVGTVEIVPTVEPTAERVRERIEAGPILVAPRLWDGLSADLRADRRVIELRYTFRDHDLDALASALGWERREVAHAR